jgi:hypothetical protein
MIACACIILYCAIGEFRKGKTEERKQTSYNCRKWYELSLIASYRIGFKYLFSKLVTGEGTVYNTSFYW